jgi:glycosyltransferase involved in cell wall biosynthesis
VWCGLTVEESGADERARHAGMKPILVLLRPPPPLGGGEILHGYLRERYSTEEGYRVLEISSKARDKRNQGSLALWKIQEFVVLWFRVVRELVVSRPRLFFMAIGKGFPHFLRDSALIWVARFLGVPVVVELHGMGFAFLGASRLADGYARLVLSKTRSVRVLGPSIAESLRHHGIVNTVVIDNGVRVGDNVAVRDGESSRKKNSLLYVGTLSPNKGFDVLVDAVRLLTRSGMQVTVQCVGEWSSQSFRAQMTHTLRELALEDLFVIHGPKHRGEEWDLFAGSEVLVLPSHAEGQPLVILEAFAYGLAVVSTRVGAIPDTVEDQKNGFLVSPGDSQALASSLLRLFQDRAMLMRIQAANQQLFKERFSLELFLARHEEWLTRST